jgi:hypothetical protein
VTKRKEPEAPEVAPLTVDPNPPTEPVPEDSIPLPEEPVGEQPQSAPVWEGGDPGEAVPSPNDTPDIYHPEPDAPPPEPEVDDPDEDVPVPDAPAPQPIVVDDDD